MEIEFPLREEVPQLRYLQCKKNSLSKERIRHDYKLIKKEIRENNLRMAITIVLDIMETLYNQGRIYHFYKVYRPVSVTLMGGNDIAIKINWKKTDSNRFPKIDLMRI